VTSVEASPEDRVAPPTAGDAAPGTPPDVPAALARGWFRRRLLTIVVVVVAFGAVVAGFEVVVTGVWFHARQRQLASDFKVGRSRLAPGDAAAVLQIPRLGVNLYVVEGDTVDELRSGRGHRPGTPLPGRLGNSVIVGHRRGWGHPFADLGHLEPGKDLIVVRIRSAEPTVFRVRSLHHVAGDDTSLLAPSKDHRLTLVTGDGGALSDDRLVVTAVSGTPGEVQARRATVGDPAEESVVFNREVGLGLLAFGLAWIAFGSVRRRYGIAATAAVVVPLAVAGMVCLLLDLDLVLAPLR
jgi:LPXTG-site transpeptidase (sortase) family protein